MRELTNDKRTRWITTIHTARRKNTHVQHTYPFQSSYFLDTFNHLNFPWFKLQRLRFCFGFFEKKALVQCTAAFSRMFPVTFRTNFGCNYHHLQIYDTTDWTIRFPLFYAMDPSLSIWFSMLCFRCRELGIQTSVTYIEKTYRYINFIPCLIALNPCF